MSSMYAFVAAISVLLLRIFEKNSLNELRS